MGDDTPIEKLGHSVTKKLDHNSYLLIFHLPKLASAIPQY